MKKGKSLVKITTTAAVISPLLLSLYLIDRNNDLSNELNVKSKRINYLESENKEIGQEKQKVDEQLKRLIDDNNSLNGTINNITNQLNQMKKEVEELKQWQSFKATAYSTYANGDELSAKKWGNLTASGTTVEQGRTIAVDKNVIPLGTKIEIKFPPGFEHLNGIYIAEDTGSAIKGNKIDVYLNSISECNRFGIRNIRLKIMD